jgi:ABC-type phosphate transport system substrate-binding protein
MAGLPKRLFLAGFGLALSLALGSARADIVVVVSAKSSVKILTRAQLANIYLGRTNRLPNGDTATPIDQRGGSRAHAEFYSEYLGRSEAQIEAHWARLIFTGRGQPPRTAPDAAAVAAAVAGNPDAIGYIDFNRVDGRLRVVSIE